jgi:hypothetical protein
MEKLPPMTDYERAVWDNHVATARELVDEFVKSRFDRSAMEGPSLASLDSADALAMLLLPLYLTAVADRDGIGAVVTEDEIRAVLDLVGQIGAQALHMVTSAAFLNHLRARSYPGVSRERLN